MLAFGHACTSEQACLSTASAYPGTRRRPEYRSTAEHMLHLCKDKDYAVPALASAYTLAVSQAAKRFRVRA